MSSTMVPVEPRLGVALLVLTLVAAGVALLGRLGYDRQIVVAATRAAAQLAVVALVIAAIVDSLHSPRVHRLHVRGGRPDVRTEGDALPERLVGRLSHRRRHPSRAGRAAGCRGAAAHRSGSHPCRRILIGGAMTATSLAGRIALDQLAVRRGEVEAAIALGLVERDAALEVCRSAAGEALTPPGPDSYGWPGDSPRGVRRDAARGCQPVGGGCRAALRPDRPPCRAGARGGADDRAGRTRARRALDRTPRET